MEEKYITATGTYTGNQCKHENGWYFTAEIFIFRKRYFICSDCGNATKAS